MGSLDSKSKHSQDYLKSGIMLASKQTQPRSTRTGLFFCPAGGGDRPRSAFTKPTQHPGMATVCASSCFPPARYCHTIHGYWYTMQGYYHTILAYWHTILTSSYTSNPWGKGGRGAEKARRVAYSHTTLARKYREIRA